MRLRAAHQLTRAVAIATAIVTCVLVPAQGQATRGLMWSVERGGQTDWLVGSLHMLTSDAHPLPPSMTAAFEASDTLMEEADPDELRSPEFAASILGRAFFTDGQTLETRVSPETFRLLASRGEAAGVPSAFLNRMKPWMAATTLQALELQRGGFDAALGVDAHFHQLARQRNMRFETVETAIEQVMLLESLGDAFEDALIRQTLEDARTAVAETVRIAAAWKAGDVSTVERLVVDSMKDTPEVYAGLIRNRNRAWLPRIRTCIESRHCFIVVGAGHLVGDDGLVATLRQEGYTVIQR